MWYKEQEKTPFGQIVTFAQDGLPYLEYRAESFLLDDSGQKLRPITIETGFWQIDRPLTDADGGFGLVPKDIVPAFADAESVETLRNEDDGFNLIATANDRDRGVNDLSSALRRRFNTVVLPLPSSAEEELRIVTKRVAELGRSLELPEATDAIAEIRRVVTVFRELRQGHTEDNKTSLKTPSATLSAAEAISVVTNGLALAAHFGDGVLRAEDVAAGIVGAVVKDPVADQVIWQEYLQTVVRERADWKDFYRACRQVAR